MPTTNIGDFKYPERLIEKTKAMRQDIYEQVYPGTGGLRTKRWWKQKSIELAYAMFELEMTIGHLLRENIDNKAAIDSITHTAEELSEDSRADESTLTLCDRYGHNFTPWVETRKRGQYTTWCTRVDCRHVETFNRRSH